MRHSLGLGEELALLRIMFQQHPNFELKMNEENIKLLMHTLKKEAICYEDRWIP